MADLPTFGIPVKSTVAVKLHSLPFSSLILFLTRFSSWLKQADTLCVNPLSQLSDAILNQAEE